MTPAKRSSGGSSKRGGKRDSAKARGSKADESRGAQSAGRSSLEDRLDELQPWQRWHSRGPQATGLGRMEQWVSAYAEGTLVPGGGDSPGPSGVIPD